VKTIVFVNYTLELLEVTLAIFPWTCKVNEIYNLSFYFELFVNRRKWVRGSRRLRSASYTLK
jgi:hypothetical protein